MLTMKSLCGDHSKYTNPPPPAIHQDVTAMCCTTVCIELLTHVVESYTIDSHGIDKCAKHPQSLGLFLEMISYVSFQTYSYISVRHIDYYIIVMLVLNSNGGRCIKLLPALSSSSAVIIEI